MKLQPLFIACFAPGLLWSTHWAIIANGPPLPTQELQEGLQDRKVLVLDGAANRFKSSPICLDCILGDFDSIEDPLHWGISAVFAEMNELAPPYEGNFGITIIPAKDQNYTDLEKGILYCDKMGATSILIFQATGGRMDHTMGNLGLLRKYYRSDRDLVIIKSSPKSCVNSTRW